MSSALLQPSQVPSYVRLHASFQAFYLLKTNYMILVYRIFPYGGEQVSGVFSGLLPLETKLLILEIRRGFALGR